MKTYIALYICIYLESYICQVRKTKKKKKQLYNLSNKPTQTTTRNKITKKFIT